MAVFLIYLSNLGLKMLGSTTFFTNFLMMDRLIKIRHGLEHTVIHLDWTTYMNKSSWRTNDWRRSAIEARHIKANINDGNFGLVAII